MNKVKRNYSIDIARGIAILFVVSWHCRVGNFGVTMWVMPLFFFIMGVFYHTPISLKLQIRKKTNQLLIPFVIWSIPYFIYYLFTKPFLAFVKMWLKSLRDYEWPIVVSVVYVRVLYHILWY